MLLVDRIRARSCGCNALRITACRVDSDALEKQLVSPRLRPWNIFLGSAHLEDVRIFMLERGSGCRRDVASMQPTGRRGAGTH